jgi:glycosyltransferase involved in cell wall biosynthesis
VPYERVPHLLQSFDVALNYIRHARVMDRQPQLKALECRALGLPQISTRIASNAEVIREGENGVLVEDSPRAYAAAMERLTDPAVLIRLRRMAVQMRTGVAWEDVADRYLAIYAALFEVRKASATPDAGAAPT